MRANMFADQAYLAAGNWKCPNSPSGAHYFVGDSAILRCKYCPATREGIPTNVDLLQLGRQRGANIRSQNARVRRGLP